MTVRLTDKEFITAFKQYPSIEAMAKGTGLNIRGIYSRRKNMEAKHGILLEASRPPPKPRSASAFSAALPSHSLAQGGEIVNRCSHSPTGGVGGVIDVT